LDDGSIEVEGMGVTRLDSKKWPTRVNTHTDTIYFLSGKYGVPAHYIAGVEGFESGGAENATSRDAKGNPLAYGVMQITPGTANVLAPKIGRTSISPNELYDPALSLELGTIYLADLLKRYQGDFVNAAVGYNAGKVICGGCRTGVFWGVCTDGSPYPLRAIQYANAALVNGFPLTGPPPNVRPLPIPPGHPFWAFAFTAAASYAAYRYTERRMGGRRRGRSASLWA
jgi:hypothetical protein